MKDKTIQRVLAVFLVVAAVLVFVAVAAIRNINRAAASSDWVNHTHAVIMEADAILASLHAAEGALRAYLLTGDARDKAASREAFAAVSERYEVAKALTRGETRHMEKMGQLQVLLNQRTELARRMVDARDRGRDDEVKRALAEDAGSTSLRDVTRLIERMKEEEAVLLTERDRASFLQAQTTRWTVLGGVAINFLLLAGAAWLVRDDIAARQRAAAALGEANARLEAKVQERTAELVAANDKLVSENHERQWANQALEHQLRYNHLIINAISDLVVVLSKVGNITRVNPAVTHWTGRQPAELIGTPLGRITRVLPPAGSESAPHFDLVAQTIKEGRELHDVRATVLAGEGRTKAARLSLFPLRDRDKVVGAVVTIRADTAAT